MTDYSLSALKDVVSSYELLLVDLWGVIHDGHKPYKGAINTVEYLNKIGKKIIFLSNAPRRAEQTRRQLIDFGIGPDLYEKVITSGELAFEYFTKMSRGKLAENYKNYFYIGSDRDDDVMSGSGLKRVARAAEANLVVATGFNLGDAKDAKDDLLQEAIEANLPMFCLNPDLEIHKLDGRVHYCAGVLAKRYRSLGGKVKFFGKPEPDTYKKILQDYALDKQKILCIGDNMQTDIKGAFKYNLASALILWGIPAQNLLYENALPTAKTLQKFLKREKYQPTYICPEFLV